MKKVLRIALIVLGIGGISFFIIYYHETCQQWRSSLWETVPPEEIEMNRVQDGVPEKEDTPNEKQTKKSEREQEDVFYQDLIELIEGEGYGEVDEEYGFSAVDF